MSTQANNPLHGVTLKVLVQELVDRYGWDGLASLFDFACFHRNPSLNSTLKFLRKTPWARAKVERLWVADWRAGEKKRKRNAARKARRAHAAEMGEQPVAHEVSAEDQPSGEE